MAHSPYVGHLLKSKAHSRRIFTECRLEFKIRVGWLKCSSGCSAIEVCFGAHIDWLYTPSACMHCVACSCSTSARRPHPQLRHLPQQPQAAGTRSCSCSSWSMHSSSNNNGSLMHPGNLSACLNQILKSLLVPLSTRLQKRQSTNQQSQGQSKSRGSGSKVGLNQAAASGISSGCSSIGS